MESLSEEELNLSLSNRRLMPRFPFHSHGTLWLGADPVACTLIDISLKGALFSFAHMLVPTVGYERKLTMHSAGDSAFLTVCGRIKHVKDRLIGIDFVYTSKSLDESLQRLIDPDRDLPALSRP